MVRCTSLDGMTYCLHLGFTGADPHSRQWREEVDGYVDQPRSGTGDKRLVDTLRERAAMPYVARRAADIREIQEAWQGVGKARLVDYWRRGVTAPASLFATHSSLPRPAAPDCPNPDGCAPSARAILWKWTEQIRSYYCGPAAFQMIDYGDDGTLNPQDDIANNWLGTTTAGTSISSMVSATNDHTGWDGKAGPYVVQSVSGWTTANFLNAHANEIGLYGAPVIEHVLLRDEFFDYLRYDHGGHFQMGRAYNYSGDLIGIFEPFDERDWSSGGYATAGPHNDREAYQMLNATKADMSNFGI